jgi:hypothetical protein
LLDEPSHLDDLGSALRATDEVQLHLRALLDRERAVHVRGDLFGREVLGLERTFALHQRFAAEKNLLLRIVRTALGRF